MTYAARIDLDHDREALEAWIRSRRWIRVEGKDLPYPVTVSIGIADDGRLACTGLIIGGVPTNERVTGYREITAGRLVSQQPMYERTWDAGEITSASLRGVRLADILQSLAALTADDDDFGAIVGLSIRRAAEELPAPRARSARLPDEHFATVAKEYRRALRVAPQSPVRELCQRMGEPGRPVPEPTVRRWVQRARDRGLLGESTPGKAGERPRKEHEE